MRVSWHHGTCDCCDPGVTPGPCLGLCLVGSIAVTIEGAAKCADIINCCAPGFCPFPTGYNDCNTQLFGSPPNGTHILYPCPAPATGCQFFKNLNQGAPAAEGSATCRCGQPYPSGGATPPTVQTCNSQGQIENASSYMMFNLSFIPPVNQLLFASLAVQIVVPGARVCTVCCPPFSPEGNVVRSFTGWLSYGWQMPNGNTTVTRQQFCDGVPLIRTGQVGAACFPCGFNGAGTWGTNHQAVSTVTMTIQRAS